MPDSLSMQVSVIIPNYNHAAFLKQRIESVLSQTYQGFEIILLDDGSTDNSKEIIEQYRNHPKVAHVIYSKTNSGSVFKQWQKGVTLAKGSLIWVAESDDSAAPGFLEKMVALLQQNDKVGLAYCRTMQIDEAGNETVLNKWPDVLDGERWTKPYVNSGLNELQHYLLYRNVIVNASSAIIKKEHALSAIEYVLEKDMLFCGDWLFYARILGASGIAYSPEVLNFQRYHASTTRSHKTIDGELQRIKESVECIKEIRNFLKIEIDWHDERYMWIYQFALERASLSLKMTNRLIEKSETNKTSHRVFKSFRRHLDIKRRISKS